LEQEFLRALDDADPDFDHVRLLGNAVSWVSATGA
ncbi:MAG: hypothetical protein QOD62_3284, partial [Actinomycetota bacterium]|nr:hypothetical protein [Actinomycetota bacterium]